MVGKHTGRSCCLKVTDGRGGSGGHKAACWSCLSQSTKTGTMSLQRDESGLVCTTAEMIEPTSQSHGVGILDRRQTLDTESRLLQQQKNDCVSVWKRR